MTAVEAPCQRAPATRKTRFCFLLLWSAALAAFPVAANERPGPQWQVGLAEFALAAGRAEEALVRIGETRGDAASWVRARALLATGQVEAAKRRLEQQLTADSHRGDAALVLGQMATQSGDDRGAREYFNTASRLGFGNTRQRALYELSMLDMADGKPDAAGQVLAGMEPGYWAALGYANLAAHFSKQDLNASRPLVALRVALAMSEQDVVSDRSNSLRSQLLVRAAYLSFQQEDYDKAIGFLEQVPLDSYYTPRALYLHGLSLDARDNYRGAMQSWHRAKKYPLAYPGVEDSWLGMGRGYDLSGYLGQAGEAYLAASASYESERATLRELASRIREEGAWKALVNDARGTDAQWFLADSRTLAQPRLAYLMRFMESGEAQRKVNRVAELVRLDQILASREQSLTVFRRSLSDLSSVPVATAVDEQQRLNARLEQLKVRAMEMQQRMAGASSSGAELKVVATMLAGVGRGLGSLESRLEGRTPHLSGLERRIDAALSRLQSLRGRAQQLRISAEQQLNDEAIAFVSRQDERMVLALDKAEQRIAHLYEYLALESIERGAQ